MDDQLLRTLGRHQREALDEPPEPLALEDPWREALEPIADDERERMLDAVFATVDGAAATGPATTGPPTTGPPVPAPIDLAARRRRVAIGFMLGLAATLALLAFGWRELTNPRNQVEVARLPEFATSQLQGGVASQRGDSDEAKATLTLAATDEIDWVVTPSEPIRRELGVALLVEPELGPAQLVTELAAEVTPSGVVRVQGRLDRFVALTPGAWTLTLLIAEPDQLPSELEQARAHEQARWRTATIHLRVVSGQ